MLYKTHPYNNVIANFYNSKIIELFDSYPNDLFLSRVPMIYDDLQQSDILFVGINPSFISIEKSFKFVQNHSQNFEELKYLSELSFEQYKSIFQDVQRLVDNLKILGDIHSVFKGKYVYFNKFKFIAEYLNVKIEHLDLIPIRETSQSLVAGIIGQNHEFKTACLDLFYQTIELINPKAVIIENSVVRDMVLSSADQRIKNYFPDYSFKHFINSDVGTPINDNGVAIYYTSMLTGQRAMDLGSYHRLLWSLNKFFSLKNR